MSKRRCVWLLFVGALLCAQAALADSTKVPVKGLLKSGSGSGGGAAPVVVLDDDADPSSGAGSGKILVLTQACFKIDANNTVTLAAGGLAIAFAASNSNAGAGCQSFTPGYVVPEGTPVTCSATGAAAFSCAVSGIVTKAQ